MKPQYLVTLSLAIGALIAALKSDTLNAQLARLSLPPIPKPALPWLSLALGLAAGVVAALMKGEPWDLALATSFQGLLGGGFAIAGNEALVESTGRGRNTRAAVAVAKQQEKQMADDSPYITLCRKLEADAAALKTANDEHLAAVAVLTQKGDALKSALDAFQASDAAVKAASDALNPLPQAAS